MSFDSKKFAEAMEAGAMAIGQLLARGPHVDREHLIECQDLLEIYAMQLRNARGEL